MLGDVGFDPLFLSTKADEWLASAPYKVGQLSGLDWYREAEIMHGRIAQLAVVGFIAPGLFGTFPGNDWTGTDAYAYTNPLEELSHIPYLAGTQIVLFMTLLEFRRLMIIQEEGPNYTPGDNRIGQTGWNPFGLNYSPEKYEEKRLQELKHCRLAMIGVLGLYFQAGASGVGVVEQISGALVYPDYVAKAGYFLPEGI